MPYTTRQRRAAQAEYGRRKRGLKPQKFKSMSKAQLKKWAESKKLEKKKRATPNKRRKNKARSRRK